jgi:hypothetical protein
MFFFRRRHRARARTGFRPAIEVLEDRTAPAAVGVAAFAGAAGLPLQLQAALASQLAQATALVRALTETLALANREAGLLLVNHPFRMPVSGGFTPAAGINFLSAGSPDFLIRSSGGIPTPPSGIDLLSAGSPGVLSGNVVQVPIHIPVNLQEVFGGLPF